MILSEAFARAMVDAESYHHEQSRKSTDIPYVSHLLGVCSLVLEAGGSETEAIAALLHDAAEDCGGRPVLAAIETKFGPDVARIVEACSDAFVAVGEVKPPWRQRKTTYIEHLRRADESTLLVSAADKLHNLRAIQADFMQIGDSVFDRFSTGGSNKRVDVLWYYHELYDVYVQRLSDDNERLCRLTKPLREVLRWFDEPPESNTSNRARTQW
jgi:(p)ppGpp synthase/HD superfamily hydrolase